MRPVEIELHHVRLPLIAPFATRQGTTSHKEAVLVRVRSDDGAEGWGECPAEVTPRYLPEHLAGCWLVLRDHLAPRALAGDALDEICGNHLARAALSTALADAELRTRGVSLAAHLGGTRARVAVGVVVELHERPGDTAAAAEARAAQGYRRIKVKIAPGRDLDHVRAARGAIGDRALWADANGAYRLADLDRLASLDVDLLEQPLRAGDLLDHAEAAAKLAVPVCLDESLRSVDDARLARHLRAGDVWCVKPSAVGGLAAAVAIHDLGVAAGVPLWCGGLLETGVGRAANLAVASLAGMTLPGDLSASSRYFARDVTEPFEIDAAGTMAVPDGPGIGVTPDPEALAAVTVRRERITRR